MYKKEKQLEVKLKTIEKRVRDLNQQIATAEQERDEIFSTFPEFSQVKGGTKFKLLFDYSGTEYMALEAPIHLYENCLPLRAYVLTGENSGRLLCEISERHRVVVLE